MKNTGKRFSDGSGISANEVQRLLEREALLYEHIPCQSLSHDVEDFQSLGSSVSERVHMLIEETPLQHWATPDHLLFQGCGILGFETPHAMLIDYNPKYLEFCLFHVYQDVLYGEVEKERTIFPRERYQQKDVCKDSVLCSCNKDVPVHAHSNVSYDDSFMN